MRSISGKYLECHADIECFDFEKCFEHGTMDKNEHTLGRKTRKFRTIKLLRLRNRKCRKRKLRITLQATTTDWLKLTHGGSSLFSTTQLNTFLPHPVYGWMSWVCILNPNEEQFRRLFPLLDESYRLVVQKYAKRVKS